MSVTAPTTQYEETGQPPSSLALRVTVAIIFLYICLALALLPIAAMPGPNMPGLLTLCATGIFLAELATAWLLSALFREDRSWPLLLLFCAYLYSALMALSQLLTFSGAILEDRPVLVANNQVAGWIYVAWIYGFGILTFASVALEVSTSRWRVTPEKAMRYLIIALLAVLAGVVVVTGSIVAHADALPAIFAPQRFALTGVRAGAVTLFCISIAIILFRIRDRNPLYLWLSLALTALIFQNVLSGAGGARYAIGWSIGRASWLISATALFIYFLNLFSTQQRLLTRTRDLLEQYRDVPSGAVQGGFPAHYVTIDNSIEKFVARENIGRYQVMLRSPLESSQRHAISNLLAEEERRLKALSHAHDKPAVRPSRIDHLF